MRFERKDGCLAERNRVGFGVFKRTSWFLGFVRVRWRSVFSLRIRLETLGSDALLLMCSDCIALGKYFTGEMKMLWEVGVLNNWESCDIFFSAFALSNSRVAIWVQRIFDFEIRNEDMISAVLLNLLIWDAGVFFIVKLALFQKKFFSKRVIIRIYCPHKKWKGNEKLKTNCKNI